MAVASNPDVVMNPNAGLQWPALLANDFWGHELLSFQDRCNGTWFARKVFEAAGDCTEQAFEQAARDPHDAVNPRWSHLSYRPLTVATLRWDATWPTAVELEAMAPRMHRTNA
eukprot:CAMPEP_0196795102 /NCGR_PEP_ID=MMETSP1104-20130614/35437_1 /TAXON_ID=33652 /ORGANISM="Cafeteria sp., Strain Caron Lab Isolate" /LENGTH=112 /DNA_ID=CAMNT_0042165491 /DNA_START=27 /DNA_END=361 /DNA_ORIENTATION=+